MTTATLTGNQINAYSGRTATRRDLFTMIMLPRPALPIAPSGFILGRIGEKITNKDTGGINCGKVSGFVERGADAITSMRKASVAPAAEAAVAIVMGSDVIPNAQNTVLHLFAQKR